LDQDEERRRFQRLLLTLPLEYTSCHPESGEVHQGQGILKDFSLSGVYFHSLDPLPLEPGNTLMLTISTPLAPLSHCDFPYIQVQAQVVRLEGPSPDSGYHGVAVCFLEYPTFINLANQNLANQVNMN